MAFHDSTSALLAIISSPAPFLPSPSGVVTLPCPAPAAGPAWPPPGPAAAPSAPRSPAPGDSSSSRSCPAGCEDAWTRPSPPERRPRDQSRRAVAVLCSVYVITLYEMCHE